MKNKPRHFEKRSDRYATSKWTGSLVACQNYSLASSYYDEKTRLLAIALYSSIVKGRS